MYIEILFDYKTRWTRSRGGGGRCGRGKGEKLEGSLPGRFFAKSSFILCEMEFRSEQVTTSFTLAFSQHSLFSPSLEAVIFASTMIVFGTCVGAIFFPIFQFQKASSRSLQPSVIDVIIIRAHLKL